MYQQLNYLAIICMLITLFCATSCQQNKKQTPPPPKTVVKEEVAPKDTIVIEELPPVDENITEEVVHKIDTNKIVGFIQTHIDQVKADSTVAVQGIKLFSVNLLPAFYKAREYHPAWLDEQLMNDAFRTIEGAAKDGLNPDDYHLQELLKLRENFRSIEDIDYDKAADYDILITDGLLMYAFHLLYGKVDPEGLDANWNFGTKKVPENALQMLMDAVKNKTILESPDLFRPQRPRYYGMMKALAELRKLDAAGGFPIVSEGETLHPKDKDVRVIELSNRLVKSGHLVDSLGVKDSVFSPALTEAVKVFQEEYGLVVDGIVGKGTLGALNKGIKHKIDKIRVNLERARWVMHNLGSDFVLVNIPSFSLYVLKDNHVVHSTKVMVGKTYHKTPVFKDIIEYADVNPTWTATRNITVNEILPQLKRKGAGYLTKNNMTLLKGGARVNPWGIDFNQYTKRTFPYVVRQEPGPKNALGEIKFIFPNKHSVYLHDTPSRHLFVKESRAFSHGCIRVQDPLQLGEVLLGDSLYSKAKLQSIVDSRKNTRIKMTDKMEVLILYWTAAVDEEGNMFFHEDIYKRDGRILASLEEKFMYDPTMLKKYYE